MLDACTLTIVRNGDDFLEPCIEVIAPHVRRVRITVDNRTTDNTLLMTERLRRKFQNVEVKNFHVLDPLEDLVHMRNSQLGFPEKWGFIIDSDEYHYDIASYELKDDVSYAFKSWAIWKPHFAHIATSRRSTGRIFKNAPDIHWTGRFNQEVLYNGSQEVFKHPVILPYRYVHFTHVKKDNWRQELKKERNADGRALTRVPGHVWEHIRTLEENMQIMPQWRIPEGSEHGDESTGELSGRKRGHQ